MPEFAISLGQILWICSFIGAVWGVWKIIKEIRKPNDDLKAIVQKHSELLDADNRRLNNVEGSDRMLLRCMLVIINHDITGNGIDKLKETRDELNEYLIKH